MVETIAANQRCFLAEPMVRAAAAGMVCVQKLILDDDSSWVQFRSGRSYRPSGVIGRSRRSGRLSAAVVEEIEASASDFSTRLIRPKVARVSSHEVNNPDSARLLSYLSREVSDVMKSQTLPAQAAANRKPIQQQPEQSVNSNRMHVATAVILDSDLVRSFCYRSPNIWLFMIYPELKRNQVPGSMVQHQHMSSQGSGDWEGPEGTGEREGEDSCSIGRPCPFSPWCCCPHWLMMVTLVNCVTRCSRLTTALELLPVQWSEGLDLEPFDEGRASSLLPTTRPARQSKGCG